MEKIEETSFWKYFLFLEILKTLIFVCLGLVWLSRSWRYLQTWKIFQVHVYRLDYFFILHEHLTTGFLFINNIAFLQFSWLSEFFIFVLPDYNRTSSSTMVFHQVSLAFQSSEICYVDKYIFAFWFKYSKTIPVSNNYLENLFLAECIHHPRRSNVSRS